LQAAGHCSDTGICGTKDPNTDPFAEAFAHQKAPAKIDPSLSHPLTSRNSTLFAVALGEVEQQDSLVTLLIEVRVDGSVDVRNRATDSIG